MEIILIYEILLLQFFDIFYGWFRPTNKNSQIYHKCLRFFYITARIGHILSAFFGHYSAIDNRV